MKKLVVLLSGIALGFSSAQAIVQEKPAKFSSTKHAAVSKREAKREASFSHAQPVLQARSNCTYNVSFHGVNYQKLVRAERTILGRTYEHQDADIRLSRLERAVFNRIHPHLSYDQRLDNLILNASNNSTIGIPQNNLSKMEQRVLNRTFGMDTTKNRIERLEENMFGAVQSGDLVARYETLNRASTSYKAPVVYNTQPSTGWRRTVGNMIMGGTVTGMTPPLHAGMDPYSDFIDNRAPGGRAHYHTGNRGWGYGGQSIGTRTGVTILD